MDALRVCMDPSAATARIGIVGATQGAPAAPARGARRRYEYGGSESGMPQGSGLARETPRDLPPRLASGCRRLGLVSALCCLAATAVAEPTPLPKRTLAIGILAHDRGFAADKHESGVDLNLEVLFAPLDFAGSPRPHLGATLNFAGDTSVAYAGVSFPAFERAAWFTDLLLSAAIHDGPLHKDPAGCDAYSNCGYGIRVMPRFGVEAGYRLPGEAALSLYYDHMSHKWIIGGENEGLDHIGIRYRRPY